MKLALLLTLTTVVAGYSLTGMYFYIRAPSGSPETLHFFCIIAATDCYFIFILSWFI